MHVLYIVGQSTGGLPHYTAELANAVSEHADVTVMKPAETTADDLFDEEVTLIDAFDHLGVSMPQLYKLDVNPLDFARGFLSYRNVKRLRGVDVDIVHDTTDLFPQVKLFLKLYGIDDRHALVVTRHEVSSKRLSLSRPPVMVEDAIDYVIPDLNVARVVVHTENQRRAMIGRGTPPEAIDVIPHGAYSVFGDHSDVDAPTERNCLLFFGNVVTPKGIDTLVEAIPLVKREVPDVTLLIAGEGNIPERSRAIIGAHEENFEVHDYFVPNDRVKEFFARAEVVTLPYRFQDGTKGHSGALATAFSFGKPVVASTAGEFESLVGETESGLVVPPEDPERLADAIVRVLTDDEARQRMAANSLRMAERLSWDSVAERYLAVYESVLAGRAVHRPVSRT
ncbi:glycosyltransferase family 4 protein [Halogeometricum luteum]|uniref:Glycosyltransferase family 4 protein n=1 Tax=Halogeometricum luteum TaxID=2950537 RepID=A0ABU2G3E1_9EURY|nr:glycosyltransferase family 4 protein [Halogeometricum sp. S3BR5-2]MDS0295305.1 glycosyltransferase family 4 protein [Halogeometricum sp. S3BR5-2]